MGVAEAMSRRSREVSAGAVAAVPVNVLPVAVAELVVKPASSWRRTKGVRDGGRPRKAVLKGISERESSHL